ncbi:MAG: hypothetical protein ACOX2L_04495 [Anaerolineae bacterium]|jgi:hypothetical protein|nr:hypothetical protein [Chloroflexota bacterium]
MIRSDGTIHFAEELLTLVEHFVLEYQEHEGPFEDDLERALVVAFALSALECDLGLLRDCVERQPMFKHIQPQNVLDECSERDIEVLTRRRQEVAGALRERGWLP